MVKIITVILFLLCFTCGLWLTFQRPLWGDEVFSQVTEVQTLSYRQMLFERGSEPNKSPLFYIIQKFICDTCSFHLSFEWKGNAEITDARAQFFMRLAPNIYMSLSLAILFYFFARYYSLILGVYVFLTGLSSFIVWSYWVEARHYPLWFLFSMLQAMVMARILESKQHQSYQWQWLACVHALLILTNIISVAQIALGTFILWICKEKRFKECILLNVFPMFIFILYYNGVAGSPLFLKGGDGLSFIEVILHREWAYVFLMYWLFVGLRRIKQYHPAALFTTAMAIMTGAIVLFYIITSKQDQSRDMTYRYFLYLAPISIVGLGCIVHEMFKAFKQDRWACSMLVIVLAGLMVVRYLKTYIMVLGIYHW